MTNIAAFFNLKKLKDYADWKLLLFLILFLNIKMPVKILAIVFIYLLQFNFKFGFRLKNSRLPLFYLLIIPIAIIGLLINKNYQDHNYLLIFATGIGFWLLSLLAVHQIKLMVEQTDNEKIHGTIIVFFILNAIISLLNIALIIKETGSINPYTFTGLNRTYFIMTGDFIKGISFDISSTNAVLSTLGVIYFLDKKLPAMVLICMITLLLTYSNLVNLILFFIIALLFIFKSDKDQKSIMVVCGMLFLVFMLKVSPENGTYLKDTLNTTLRIKDRPAYVPITDVQSPVITKPYNLLTFEEKRRRIAIHYLDSLDSTKPPKKPEVHLAQNVLMSDKGRIYIPPPPTNTEQNYLSKAMEPERKRMLAFINGHEESLPLSIKPVTEHTLPGKLTSVIQTLIFLYKNPADILTGMGIGNFSSKIAFRATGLGIRGQYPKNYVYINKAFLSNHLDLYMSFFSKDVAFRSVKNNPFSVYDQLLAEYGLLGLLAFLIFYLGFFARQYHLLTYGLPVLVFAMMIFFIDYWFEQLSVMILFELLLFFNIKESQNKKLITA